MAFAAVFIAKFLDPFGAVIAFALGFFVRRGIVGVVFGAVLAAIATDFGLSIVNAGHQFDPLAFSVGLIAFAVWSAFGVYLAHLRAK